MTHDIYFPALNGPVECSLCEAAECHSRDKYQRSRRDFTITSGRCPKLPGYSEPVAREWREAEAARWPMVLIELETRHVSLRLAGERRSRALYRSRPGESAGGWTWYFNRRIDGAVTRCYVRIDQNPDDLNAMFALIRMHGSLRAELMP